MKFLPTLLIIGTCLTACQKKDAAPTIDFGPNGGITQRDANGLPQGTSDPTDWTLDASWNQQELDLFKDLGFALNGTQPGGVRDIVLYPNPVMTGANLSVRQTGSATLFAYVVTDRKYKVVKELVKDAKVSASGTTFGFDFSSLKKGETYRMYYVFYTSSILVSRGHGDIKMVE